MKELIINSVLIPSLKQLYAEDYDNIRLGVSERNICARLALYMESLIRSSDYKKYGFDFSPYHVDVEYNRMGFGFAKRYAVDPESTRLMVSDLLIHQRYGGQNLLAVEMKRIGNYKGAKTDRERLIAMVSSPKTVDRLKNCVYDTLLGVYLVFSPQGLIMDLYENVDSVGVKTREIIMDYDCHSNCLLER